ncbi:MAG: polysaccharide biosynthesis protein, partial [Candidatus Marinimicrobia bacterium]|nr:polysaccharide biosynthesis protein [Candidatus Neomarinimicrobiota bacterium]
MLNKLLHLRFAVIGHDLMMAWLAWLASYALRYSIWPDSPQIEYLSFEILTVVFIQGVVAYFFNLYRGLWRFASIPDLSNIIKSAVVGTVMISLFYFLLNRLEGVPRSVLLMYPILLVLFWGLPRISYRLWKDKHLKYTNKNQPRVLLVGAGSMADSFIRNSVSNASYKIVSIVDDRDRHQGAHLRGIKIKGGLNKINAICLSQEVELIVIAKQSPSSEVIKKIIDQSVNTSSKIKILPDPDDLENSGFDINQLQPLTVEDLLGREKIQLDWTKVAEFVKNRSVLITGGGGSIGSELCRQL